MANLVIFFRYNNYTGWGEWTCFGMCLAFYTILFLQSQLSMFPQTYFIFVPMMEMWLYWFQMIAISLIAVIVEIIMLLNRKWKELIQPNGSQFENIKDVQQDTQMTRLNGNAS